MNALLGRLIDSCGRLAGWLTLVLVLVTAEQVVARYFFGGGSVALQELEWHLFGAIFLLASAYTWGREGHVRIDIFYANFSGRTKAYINLLGAVLFVLPLCGVLIYFGTRYALMAYSVSETSPDPGGLPARWLIKGMIPLAALLLLAQALRVINLCLRQVRRDHA